jgi:hypothetical protein
LIKVYHRAEKAIGDNWPIIPMGVLSEEGIMVRTSLPLAASFLTG